MARYREWSIIRKRGRQCPFGYMPDPNDPGQWLPVKEKLRHLDTAIWAWKNKTSSQDEIVEWLCAVTGDKITRAGLAKKIREGDRKLRAKSRVIITDNPHSFAATSEENASEAEEREEAGGEEAGEEHSERSASAG